MNNDKHRRIEGIVFLIAFGLTIPAANWLIGNAGTVCAPNGPCLIPVAPGLMAPSGVLMIGVALVLRDLVQRRLGVGYSGGAVLVGARSVGAGRAARAGDCVGCCVPAVGIRRSRGLYAACAPAVWSPPSWRRAWSASSSIPSCSCGSPSARSIFLPGQVVGKAWMVLLSIPFVLYLRRRDERLGLAPV